MEIVENQRFEIATPRHRIAAVFVDAGLYIVTFGIGWFIWNLILWAQGQTPAKNLLKIRVINAQNNKPATWGHMFIRQGLIPFSMSIFFLIPYYIWVFKGFTSSVNSIALVLLFLLAAIYAAVWIMDLIWFFKQGNRRLVDYWAKTLVINESNLP